MTKGIKHKDIGEDLSRTEFEADDSHELESGTSFPGSPVEKDRFYRTDLHKWYIYNGTEWRDLVGIEYESLSDNIVYNNSPVGKIITADYYQKSKETLLGSFMTITPAQIRTEYTHAHGGACTKYSRVYKNGSPIGTEHSTSVGGAQTYTEDLAFDEDDLYQIYVHNNDSSTEVWAMNQKVLGSVESGITDNDPT